MKPIGVGSYAVACVDCGAQRYTKAKPGTLKHPKRCRGCALEESKRQLYTERDKFLARRGKQ